MAIIGVDQYGGTYNNLGKFPRKALMERLYASGARKLYKDSANGVKHIGYIISGLWITLYNEWEKDEE